MLEGTYKLTQKAVFHITGKEDTTVNLLEELQEIVYDYIRMEFAYEADWMHFRSYGQEEAEDKRLKLQTSIYKASGENEIVDWALRLKTKDHYLRRRNWVYQIAVRVEAGEEATLSYAEMYYDHLVGSFSEMKPPYIVIPSLFTTLIRDERVECWVGNSPLFEDAEEMDEETKADFLDMVRDPQRHIPVMLITCPDLLNPREVARQLLGNVVVFWMNEYPMFQIIQDELQAAVQLEWDAVQVILPIVTQGKRTFHPVITSSEISRNGQEKVLAMLKQAYAENMRSDERKSFITVESIILRRNREYTLSLQRDVQSLMEEIRKLQARNASIAVELENERRKQENGVDPNTCIESMLNESAAKYDRLKQEIQGVTQELYACMGKGFTPNEDVDANLCELQHAVFICFARLGSSR